MTQSAGTVDITVSLTSTNRHKFSRTLSVCYYEESLYCPATRTKGRQYRNLSHIGGMCVDVDVIVAVLVLKKRKEVALVIETALPLVFLV